MKPIPTARNSSQTVESVQWPDRFRLNMPHPLPGGRRAPGRALPPAEASPGGQAGYSGKSVPLEVDARPGSEVSPTARSVGAEFGEQRGAVGELERAPAGDVQQQTVERAARQ